MHDKKSRQFESPAPHVCLVSQLKTAQKKSSSGWVMRPIEEASFFVLISLFLPACLTSKASLLELNTPHLFWNCDNKQVFSVAEVILKKEADDEPTPDSLQLNLKWEAESFSTTAKIASLRHAQARKKGVLINSYLFALEPGSQLQWHSKGTLPLREVSVNVFEKGEGRYRGNTRLRFSKSKLFAPTELRFNNGCEFYNMEGILFPLHENLQK